MDKGKRAWRTSGKNASETGTTSYFHGEARCCKAEAFHDEQLRMPLPRRIIDRLGERNRGAVANMAMAAHPLSERDAAGGLCEVGRALATLRAVARGIS